MEILFPLLDRSLIDFRLSFRRFEQRPHLEEVFTGPNQAEADRTRPGGGPNPVRHENCVAICGGRMTQKILYLAYFKLARCS